MRGLNLRTVAIVVASLSVAACASSSGGDGGGTVISPPPPPPPSGTPVPELSDRTAPGTATVVTVLLDGDAPLGRNTVTFTHDSGVITGGQLNTLDIDGVGFTNPANGEFSRVVQIEGDNLFGVVGSEIPDGQLPPTGTVTIYNQGWVGITAIFEDDVYVLEGDATFTADWGDGNVDGTFSNLSGIDQLDQDVNNVGTILLDNATITGDGFSGGTVSGTQLFGALGDDSSTTGTQGLFYGLQADELGGVLVINDVGEDILILGAYQAD